MTKQNIRVMLPPIEMPDVTTVAYLQSQLASTLGCVPPLDQGGVVVFVGEDATTGEVSLRLAYDRPETDEEYAARLEKESNKERFTRLRLQAEADTDRCHRRDLYETLKKEFEP